MNERGTKTAGAGSCPKHKNYKGLRPTKRDCPECRALHRRVQRKLRSKKPYRSIVSPSERVSCFHMLAELACYQRFGKLPPGFWRKGSGVKEEIRDHYNRTYKMLMAWRKKKIPARGGTWNPVDAIDTVFYYLCLQQLGIEDQRVRSTRIERKRREPELEKPEVDEEEAVEDFGGGQRKTKFQALLGLGGEDGEED